MFVRHALMLLAASLLLPVLPALAAIERPAEEIQQRTRVVLGALVERRAEFRADHAKLERFVREELQHTFDHEYSARLVLGRHGRDVDAAKVREFADALTGNLLRRYGRAMLDFDPRIEVRVVGETKLRDGKLLRVATQIQRRDGATVPVDYMLRPVGDGWKVFDVIVEGVSYVHTYRNQFEQVLRTQTLDQVIANLRRGTLSVGS